jgi:hypothetical protein
MPPQAKKEPPELVRAKKAFAAHKSWAGTGDRTERCRPGKEAALARIIAGVDPHHKMSPAALERAIESELKAYFTALAIRSWETRRNRNSGRRRASGAGDAVASR